MKIELKQVLYPQPKSKIKASDGKSEGKYKFFTSSPMQTRFIDEANYDKPSLIFGTGGNASVHFCDEPFSTSTDCLVMYGRNKIELESIYNYLKGNISLLEHGFKGAGLKHISKDYILAIEIELPSEAMQHEFLQKNRIVDEIIEAKRTQLLLSEDLVKSRFIEMFGTLSCNEHHYPMCALKYACRKITDGKHGGCEQEYNSGYYYVGAREIYDGEIHYDTASQIVRGDFEKDYRRCNLEQGDFVLVNTGATIGKSAIAKHPLTERTLLQKSVAMFKVKTELISAVFLKCCYDANPEMYTVKSASAQPNLLLSRINSTQIYLPPIELQRQFAAFVEQVDKSKFEIQQSLEKLEILKKSLMQQYFG